MAMSSILQYAVRLAVTLLALARRYCRVTQVLVYIICMDCAAYVGVI
jgi:hypothetical protein